MTAALNILEHIQPILEGVSVDSDSKDLFWGTDPSTGCAITTIGVGSDGDVNRAVASARAAFEDGRWSEASPLWRKQILLRFADLIARDGAELDRLDALDMGKPISEPFGNGVSCAGLMRFNAEAIDKVEGRVQTSDKNSLIIQRRVPRGVVAALVPWNFPTFVAVYKIAPALAAGNSVVLKPSELASRSSIHLARLALEAGVPPGVLNVVPGLGHIVGKALGLHGDVDMLTFTGSTAVGKLMLQYAGRSNMKLIMAECGGKSPHIVFNDGVDLDVIADRIAKLLLTNQGQVCAVGSRVLVERAVQPAIVEKLVARFKNIVAGNAIDPATTFGPVASLSQCDRVMGYINGAAAEGSVLVAGGHRLVADLDGFFVEPTIFADVPRDARIAQEEIFGPVLAVTPFDTEQEAIAVANGTEFGLGAYAWTADLSRGMRLMKGIRSTIRINASVQSAEGSGYAASYEPVGHSGVGVEGGLAGLETYMRRQQVSFSHA
jgi:acyl-CoA reductase-like NAD-dependent aldehyde dehydrogenase